MVAKVLGHRLNFKKTRKITGQRSKSADKLVADAIKAANALVLGNSMTFICVGKQVTKILTKTMPQRPPAEGTGDGGHETDDVQEDEEIDDAAEIIADKSDKHINLLALSGRWLEVCVPVGDGKQQIIVSTLYAISGASNDTTKRDETERLLAAALLRKAQLKNEPYFITTDLNIDPRKMKVLENAINQEISLALHLPPATRS